jgi:hypothetical protein
MIHSVDRQPLASVSAALGLAAHRAYLVFGMHLNAISVKNPSNNLPTLNHITEVIPVIDLFNVIDVQNPS